MYKIIDSRNIEMPRGDFALIPVTVMDNNQVPTDLSNTTIIFAAAETLGSDLPNQDLIIFSSTTPEQHDDAVNGKSHIILEPTMTDVAPKKYYAEIRLDINNKPNRIWQGYILIKSTVTKD